MSWADTFAKNQNLFFVDLNYYNEEKYTYIELGDGDEGLILKHTVTENKIFLLHGHQADFFNDSLWRLNKFLVRYLWKPLELIGVNDPTSAARNNKRKKQVEKRLIHWVKREKLMIIAGHTHRPVIPDPDEPLYFNDGSCVHPQCITAIEIASG